MTLAETMAAIAAAGTAQTKKTLMNHGGREPISGVKVSDLKIILKQIRKDQALALALYDTGHYDAQYLAGLAANGALMTPAQLRHWAETPNAPAISEYSVPWVTAEHPDAWNIALSWIDNPSPAIAVSGWATLGGLVSLLPDDQIDVPKVLALLKRVEKEIHGAPNRVRYVMNGFVIGAGTYVDAAHATAVAAARKIGTVMVDMGNTACKVPEAEGYIAASRGRPGGAKKKKTLKC
ncbi:DNA alkylation repair protein [Chitinophaga rhizosphaerae]|uniref:DNA alkylation repair protein n=1 Tax=Chitinophaga rhizosphaerae TaxID=1864947 RepID=UPI000F80E3BD|nr:DNA alkylation repair protein [Chitinophaga rhizosphaerae]